MTSLKLPEKSFFTLNEIATRWHCEGDLVLHYVSEGLLRPAIKSIELDGQVLIPDLDQITEQDRTFDASSWRMGSELFSTLQPGFSRECEWNESWPRFLYLNCKHAIHQQDGVFEWIYMSVVETFEGKEYGISQGNPIPIGSEEEEKRKPFLFPAWTAMQEPIITREERDRFEHEHGININATTDPADYSTPHLEVLREAINHFYNPRRDLDPKRDEVVAWINDRLKERGQGDSNRIAYAMFTIIKPQDHNSRKRKG